MPARFKVKPFKFSNAFEFLEGIEEYDNVCAPVKLKPVKYGLYTMERSFLITKEMWLNFDRYPTPGSISVLQAIVLKWKMYQPIDDDGNIGEWDLDNANINLAEFKKKTGIRIHIDISEIVEVRDPEILLKILDENTIAIKCGQNKLVS